MLSLALTLLADCRVQTDTDINPHTAGLGNIPGASIGQCCEACASAAWWGRGCRFSTLSKGRCWFKADNSTVVPSPGKISVEATSAAPPSPPPPPPPPAPPKDWSVPWTTVGPWNIGDDVGGRGEAGTLADAVSPASNPNLIYAGGKNNGASSGVLKSVDRGVTWTMASRGIFNSKVVALHIADAKGDHVYAAVDGGVYESVNGAASWAFVTGSEAWGGCNVSRATALPPAAALRGRI